MNSGYPGDDGPFQANTRVVAVVALAVAGAFVLLGLVLSIARAMQQRTLDRVHFHTTLAAAERCFAGQAVSCPA